MAIMKGFPDFVVVNVENAAHGFGVTKDNIADLKEAGVDVFSGGNHTFDRKEIFDFIDQEPTLLRPANYPEGTAGQGYCVLEKGGHKLAVINVMGRVFMEPLQSPFLVAEQLVAKVKEETNIILVDVHAEATAEKIAMGWVSRWQSFCRCWHPHPRTDSRRTALAQRYCLYNQCPVAAGLLMASLAWLLKVFSVTWSSNCHHALKLLRDQLSAAAY